MGRTISVSSKVAAAYALAQLVDKPGQNAAQLAKGLPAKAKAFLGWKKFKSCYMCNPLEHLTGLGYIKKDFKHNYFPTVRASVTWPASRS